MRLRDHTLDVTPYDVCHKLGFASMKMCRTAQNLYQCEVSDGNAVIVGMGTSPLGAETAAVNALFRHVRSLIPKKNPKTDK